MRPVRGALLILVLLPSFAFFKDRVRNTTICEINSHEREYAGKMVRVRGRVNQGFEWFFIEAEGCSLTLAYPNGPAELGAMTTFQPYAVPNVPFKFRLLRDEIYEKFVAYLNEQPASGPRCPSCIGCYRYEVTVAMTGLLQVEKRGEPGFGHMNAARSRLVMQSVSDVKAIDLWSKYKDWDCGMPQLTLPANPNPGWNEPISVPPFPSSEQNPK